MIARHLPDHPLCIHCGTVIADLHDGQGMIAIVGGQIAEGEYYVHTQCGWAFEQANPLPVGHAWAFLPLAKPWRAWAVTAFVDAPMAARAVGR